MKNRIFSISLAVLLAFTGGVIGCKGEEVPEVTEYTLTISSTDGGSTVPKYDCVCGEGTELSIEATPAPDYRFIGWTGDVDTIANVNAAKTTITMNDDYSITANFVKQYDLTISSTAGGLVTTPGEGTFAYDEATVVNLVAAPASGYQFVNWTGDVSAIADVKAASTTVTMNGDYTITASFAKEIWDWYDLDAIRDNPSGSYILMNDLDSTTAGYAELASLTANDGKGWQPIGSLLANPINQDIVDLVDPFTGSLDGQGYEIRDLSITRPDEDGVGLFGSADEGAVVKNLRVVNAEVTGRDYVGGLFGSADEGAVVKNLRVVNAEVTGRDCVGGLVGWSDGTVSCSYFTGSVTGSGAVGGLVGGNDAGTVRDSYFTGSVTGDNNVGGLVGLHFGVAVSNSHYNYSEVRINRQNIITIGALFGEDFEQWLANDKFLDVNERLSQEDGYYLINDVSDFKQLLAFGQGDSLKFRLKDDLDLTNEPNFYIPYLAGEFDGNGHKISNLSLSFNFGFVSHLGLFGCVASGGQVTRVGVEDVRNTTHKGDHVGGLVGCNDGTVSNSYLTGRVTGAWAVGGLVGMNHGTVSNSYSTASVTGDQYAGGLVGKNSGPVSNSFWDTETSGQATSDGGTGKTTAEMKSITTFTAWDIIVVNPSQTNPAYTWNIVDGQTYPFLSWESVS